MNDKQFYSNKRLNTCLNATEMIIQENGLASPTEALESMIQMFFDTKERPIQNIFVSEKTKQLVVIDDADEVVFAKKLKQSFVDYFYPQQKKEREQLKGQMTIEELYASDDWFFEERDR